MLQRDSVIRMTQRRHHAAKALGCADVAPRQRPGVRNAEARHRERRALHPG